MNSTTSNKVEFRDVGTVTRKKKFSERLGDEFVRIEVGAGEHKKMFSIHKQLLSEKAPVFAKMFHGGFKEAETNSASLPEDETYAFEAFVEWLYRGTISAVAVEDSHELLGLSYFASKYLLEELADRSLTALIEIDRSSRRMQSSQRIAQYCALTSESSKLRLYLVRTVSWLILNVDDAGSGDGAWSTAEFGELFKEDPILMIDVLRGLRASTKPGRKVGDPREAPKCDYHQHERSHVCPYK